MSRMMVKVMKNKEKRTVAETQGQDCHGTKIAITKARAYQCCCRCRCCDNLPFTQPHASAARDL